VTSQPSDQPDPVRSADGVDGIDTGRAGSRRSRRGRRRLFWTLVTVVLISAIGVTVVVTVRGRPPRTAPVSNTPPETAEVIRTTLVETEEVDGVLGYGSSQPVINRLAGTVTSIAAVGAAVERGQALYAVDSLPVVLFYGEQPAYRSLAPDAVGEDVHQLEQNLRDLGYTGFTVDSRYTASTAAAVRQWQDDLDLPETGTVDLGRVAFLAGPVRVAAVELRPGEVAAPERPMLSYTGTSRLVVADLEVTRRHLARPQTEVAITLPDRKEIAGTVTSVGSVAADTGDAQGQTQGGNSQTTDEPPTVPVVIAVADQAALGDLDGAPVIVRLSSEQRQDVLAVPVSALLALREGGYGLELVDVDGSRIVAVQTGIFASGMVEISGPGISEGARVGIPR
jgi:membrane fusion protein, multidrug efflux system